VVIIELRIIKLKWGFKMLKPKLFTTLKDYTWERFASDSIAGIIVGIVALPLAIAFAIASGVSPEKGIFTAIIAGFLISALGGQQGPDRRSHRSLCGHRLRYCPKIWVGRPYHRDDHGRSDYGNYGLSPFRVDD
jgi:hypothetical protein